MSAFGGKADITIDRFNGAVMPDAHQQFENRLHAHARRIIPPGSFVLPIDVAFALGAGDGEIGENIIAKMFKGGRYSEAMPRILPPEIVRDIGHGNIANGRRVLQKFVANLRARVDGKPTLAEAGTAGDSDKRFYYERVPLQKHVWQPDGSHGTYAHGGRTGKITKAEANYRRAIAESW